MLIFRFLSLVFLIAAFQNHPEAKTINDSLRLSSLKIFVSQNYFSKGNNIESIVNEAINLSKHLNDKNSEADLRRMLGVIQYFNGEYNQALKNYLEAIYLFQSVKNLKGEADVYNELGTYYRKHNKLEDALDIFNQARIIFLGLHDSIGLAASLNNTGIVHETNNNLDMALQYYKNALNIYNRINDSIGQSYCFENIGGVFLMQKKFESAEKYLLKSLNIRRNSHNVQATAMSFHYLGELFNKKGDYRRSNLMFDSSLTLARSIHYPDLEQRACFSMADNYKHLTDFKNSLRFFEMGSRLKDSLFNSEKNRQLTEMETAYQLENARKKNELLKKSIELNQQKIKTRNFLIAGVCLIFIALACFGVYYFKKKQLLQSGLTRQKIIEAEQSQRTRISHELHDNVGAQLSYVVSNLDMANLEIKENKFDSKRLEAITEMSKQAIGTLRETVWALNQESISVESFADKFKGYALKMSEMNSGVSVEFSESYEGNEILLPNTALNLFRICQESFNNALKHSSATRISIQISGGGEKHFQFSIQDNGIGFDIENLNKNGHYGLKNMQHRAFEIGAEYELLSSQGNGTSVILKLSKNNTFA